ncbi:MAG: hypothetical protein ABI568_15330, partial [Pseudarthrobacter sp.]
PGLVDSLGVSDLYLPSVGCRVLVEPSRALRDPRLILETHEASFLYDDLRRVRTVQNEQDFVETVLANYTASRRDAPDQHLLRRAALSAEFALAQYLVKGIAAGDSGMVAEAEGMLETLAADVEEHGGQAISVEPLPGQAPAGAGVNAEAGVAAEPDATAESDVTSDGVPSAAVKGLPAPAVTVAPVPSVSVAPVPAVTVIPVPAVSETNHNAAEVEASAGETRAHDAPAARSAEDTSTAAISIVDVRKH